MLSPVPDQVLARLREICLALPETTELISHGVPAFRGVAKMFAYFRHNHHGDGRTVVCVKTAGRDEQDHLIESDPDVFSWPAYIGPSGWIAMNLAGDEVDWDRVAARIETSYRLGAPPRLRGNS